MSRRNKLCANVSEEGSRQMKKLRKALKVETSLACSRTDPELLHLALSHWVSPIVFYLIGLCLAVLRQI